MKSIKIVALLVLSILLFNCKGEQELAPNGIADFAYSNTLGGVLYPFGRFKLYSYEENKKPKYEVILEVKNEKDGDGHFIINGQSAINFYFAKFEADFKKQTIQIYGVGSTKIGGNIREVNFEKDYLTRLSKVSSYQFSQDLSKLILLNDNDINSKMIFTVDKK